VGWSSSRSLAHPTASNPVLQGQAQLTRSRFTEEQITYALRHVELGSPVGNACRKLGSSEQTFYRWPKTFAGMGIADLRRLHELEDEARKLKQLAATSRSTST
jgi:putative transposase